mgnify:CR=1 FL=1
MAKAKTTTPKTDDESRLMAQDIGQVDTFVRALEQTYGYGRLLAVCPDLDLAAKMRRQIDKFNQAILEADWDGVRVHGQATIKGYQALERAYLAAGFKPIDQRAVIEAVMPNGAVLQIVAEGACHRVIEGDEREVIAIGAEAIGELFHERVKDTIKTAAKFFPGARIETIRNKDWVDDELPF